jgi:hypothetical protein
MASLSVAFEQRIKINIFDNRCAPLLGVALPLRLSV